MSLRPVVDVVVRPDYIIRYEQHDETTFVHVQVRHWTPSVARRFRSDVDAAHALLGRPVYALENPDSPLLPKFLAAHGFIPAGRVRDAEGRVVRIFGRSIHGQHVRQFEQH